MSKIYLWSVYGGIAGIPLKRKDASQTKWNGNFGAAFCRVLIFEAPLFHHLCLWFFLKKTFYLQE